MLKRVKADLNGLSSNLGVDRVITKIMVNRKIPPSDMRNFLYGGEESLHSPGSMKDMDKASDIIIDAIKNKKKIRVIGDYDQDGVSSAVIMMRALRILSPDIDFRIPDRMKDGYGINIRMAEEAKDDGVDLIVTCDNGIAAFDAVERAKELGLDIIVTDHHDIPVFIEDGEEVSKIPPADAVVNPKRPDCSYPFDSLCGAAVALKLCENIYDRYGIEKRSFRDLYQFAAMATVCDVVDLVDENRIIVKMGLEILNRTENLGLRALIKAAKLEGKEIGVYHLGFILGPCINASGRLDTASEAVELFTTSNPERAKELAEHLVSLNEQRKEMTQKGLEDTIEIIESGNIVNDDVIIVYNPEIHESIAGIIAGRIKDRYYKPAVVLTKSQNEGIAKGSGRSIEEYDMFKELSKVKELFERFGGHPMAAGLSLKVENIDEFRDKINENSELTEEDLIEKIYIDEQIPVEKVSMSLPGALEILEPFGKGNRKPCFGDKGVAVNKMMVLGRDYKIIKMFLDKGNGRQIEAVYFGDIEKMQDYLINRFGDAEVEKAFSGQRNDLELDLIYYPNINEYMGNRNLQIVISDYR